MSSGAATIFFPCLFVSWALLSFSGCGKSGDNLVDGSSSGDSAAGRGGAGGAGTGGAASGRGGTNGTAGTGGGRAGGAGGTAGATAGRGGGGGAATGGTGGTAGGRGGTTGGSGSGGTAGGRGGTTGGSGSGGTTGGRGGTTGGSGSGGTTAGRGGTTGAGGTTTGGTGGTTTTGTGGTGGTTAGRGGTTGSGGSAASAPGIGAHVIAYLPVGQAATVLTTPGMTTRATGSVIVVGIGRGNSQNFTIAGAAPKDNKGNPAYPQVGQMHPYAHPNEASGTALYALTGAIGGSALQISAANGSMSDGNSDEITLAAVEITDGTRIQDAQWVEIVQPATPVPVTSNSVTTTGPATLVAFWWGDATLTANGTASANNGFQVVESAIVAGSMVQGAMAVRTVSAAGTYNVTWTSDPVQGAQLWLIAIQ